MRNKLILSIIILAVLTGLVGVWYYQRNIYSKEVLKLEILGPEETALGQEIKYTVKYKNNGNITLEQPRLIFEYPPYTILEEGKSLRQETALDDIYPGQEKTVQFRGRLLGKEGETKKAKAQLNYQPKNLKARYESETSFTTVIKSVPLTLEFDLPTKVESGKEITFQLNYFSNSDYPLSDLGIKVEYPDGFEFRTASPRSVDGAEWDVGLLNKAQGGRIEIVGTPKGGIGEQKNFKAQLGSWQNGEFVLLKEAIRAVQIVTPALYISQQINGNPQYVANLSDNLHYEIFFKNIGSEAISNSFLVVKLDGAAFDFQTLTAPSGNFAAGDNSIVFDWRRIPKLQFLGSQEEGKIEFWIQLKKDLPISGPQDENPVLKDTVYLSQAQQDFVNKINSKLEVVQKSFYEDEVFGNQGPIPPEVGRTTTYTVIWQAKNYYNDVKNIKVQATLGKGVNLTGKINSQDNSLTFDSNSREVIWKWESLDAGKGVLDSAPNIAFQIAFTPAVYQQGQIAELIGQATITGEDQWTGQTVEGTAPAIDTTLPDDDTVSPAQGIIQ